MTALMTWAANGSPDGDVLRVLLRLGLVVRLDQARSRERSGGRVGEEVSDRHHLRARLFLK